MVNLVDDDWLPARWRTGEVSRVSARTALERAAELSGLAVEPPTMVPAVLRQLLLPLVLAALGAPTSRKEWWERFAAGKFSKEQMAELGAYLDEYGRRFALFDAASPFAQVAGLEALSGETKPVSLLVPSVATGNNVPLFTPFTEAREHDMPPEEAALWLLHAHCWDTAAIKTGAKGDSQAKGGKTTGSPTGPLGQLGVTIPEGRTLYETLLLNTPVIWDARSARFEQDRPRWEADQPQGASWEKRPPRGPMDVLTWQSRRIRLIPEETDRGVRVRRVVVCAGDRMTSLPETAWEPHTIWSHTSKPKKGQPPTRPRRHRPGEFAWQGLAALLSLARDDDTDGPRTSELLRQIGELQAEGLLPEDYLVRVHTCGLVYGTQSAVVDDALADTLPLPAASLVADSRVREAVLEAASQADQVAQALNLLSADLRRAEGSDPLPWGKGQRPGLTFLHLADIPVRRLLSGLRQVAADEERIEEGMTAWEVIVTRHAWGVADDLLAAVSPSAFSGRSQGGKAYRAATARDAFRLALARILPRAAEAGASGPDAKELPLSEADDEGDDDQ
ncbi:type I-E CRISPR-associated protein Cse1/CasA [Streptomyces sp. 8K308]|uniref:type I-E CRISPR-associated protein Cse1/CasA n=1 Tax=Streptomyces sp. 8K308 TaxID=2530388 RepID=UPI00104C4928|nr:type I-E CRISPR-associated protein Cse1/CasA [Streptomyces sp. 8K308]TDC10591.1 type I-E CRISPR-associated protein Cse1/CasA [Streptomyces sp. 8K308]